MQKGIAGCFPRPLHLNYSVRNFVEIVLGREKITPNIEFANPSIKIDEMILKNHHYSMSHALPFKGIGRAITYCLVPMLYLSRELVEP